jgi:hypothetical protein
VADQHRVRGAQLGDFVQAGADEVAGGVGIACDGEVGRVAVDDGLYTQTVSFTKPE